MEMLGKTLLGKMAMLMNVIMVEKEKTATGMSAQRRVSRARGTEEGAPRGDSLHFHNYCTDPVSESAHQEEDDFNPQTSPASETQDDQRNTEPNSGRNGEDAQCGGESIGGDSLHFHNYCTDPVSESAHQEEDDFNPQTSPASETQDDQRNTEPNSGRNGEDAQCGGESIGDVVLLSEFDHQEVVHLNPQLSPSSDPEKQDRQPSNTEPNPGRIGEDVQNGDSSNTDQNSDASDARAVKMPFICDFCGKYFNWRCTFKAHRNHHTKPFSCPQCRKGFGTKNGCNNHLLVVHSTDKPFKCTDCRKVFAMRNSLAKHRVLNPTLHTCTTCVKSFCGERTLKRHNFSDHPEKAYICSLCPKTFRSWPIWKHHKAEHSEKKYCCETCGKLFCSSSSLSSENSS
ncbi:zinc finger protein 771-like isoform X1 [Salmo salar]|uniref:Zinc finger protein 771-like isoform X1 n=1 Tax=Salmo salar TaxID=8030 RepID=A0A1S3LIG0_SALSA|nr:zinc finger protein 771-like isoform X1 [Salmo salar]